MKPYFLAACLMVIPACSTNKDSDDAPAAAESAAVAPPQEESVTFTTQDLTVDATQKSQWVYHGLREGTLVPMSKEEPWLIGTSRYMWQTNTGSSGPFAGGAYEIKDQGFDAITGCDSQRFVKDVMVQPLGSVHEGITSNWWNIADPVPKPLDTSFVIGRDSECIKLKILSYDKGLYTIQYQRLK